MGRLRLGVPIRLSVLCDEAGQQNMSAGYHLLTLGLHDRSSSIGPFLSDYESHVARNGLPEEAPHDPDLRTPLHRGAHAKDLRARMPSKTPACRPMRRATDEPIRPALRHATSLASGTIAPPHCTPANP